MFSIIAKLHVLTGSDSTSEFFRRGKKTVTNNVSKNIAQEKFMLEELGGSLKINEIVHAKVTLFILRFVYNL